MRVSTLIAVLIVALLKFDLASACSNPPCDPDSYGSSSYNVITDPEGVLSSIENKIYDGSLQRYEVGGLRAQLRELWYQKYSSLSDAQKTKIQADLNWLNNQFPDQTVNPSPFGATQK
jgi:hypothetical protein